MGFFGLEIREVSSKQSLKPGERDIEILHQSNERQPGKCARRPLGFRTVPGWLGMRETQGLEIPNLAVTFVLQELAQIARKHGNLLELPGGGGNRRAGAGEGDH